jgi:hypothetical protein
LVNFFMQRRVLRTEAQGIEAGVETGRGRAVLAGHRAFIVIIGFFCAPRTRLRGGGVTFTAGTRSPVRVSLSGGTSG